MKRRLTTLLLMAAPFNPVLSAQPDRDAVEACDTNGDHNLDRDELIQCFLKLDVPTQKAMKQKTPTEVATDAVDDMLDSHRGPVTVAEVDARLQRRAKAAKDSDPLVILSKRLSIGRKLTDAVDPRRADSSVPFVVSYTNDRVAGEHTWVASGSLTYAAAEGDVSDTLSWALLPGLDSDISTDTAPEKSTLDFSIPVRFGWINTASRESRIVDDAQFGVEFHYQTDRDIRSDVYDITVPFIFSSRKLARAGLNTYFGGDPQDRLSQFVFYWQPSLQAELTRVADAGTSTDLATLKQSGDSVRLAPAVALKLTLPYANQRVSIGAGYTHRFDLDQGWNRSYKTASVQYDLTSSVALTLVWKRGRKPPNFERVDQVLFGIGLQQGK